MQSEIQIIDKQYLFLKEILTNSLAKPTLTFKEITKIDIQGIYIIYEAERILYVGKTTRSGKVRMRELAADFRSHTFNRKLLSERLKDLGFVFETLKNELKKEWIQNEKITLEEFVKHQRAINEHIRLNLKFRFCPIEDERTLGLLEHFSISMFNPPFND